MDAPQDFCDWLSSHEHPDPVYGWLYRYHPRERCASVGVCKLVLARDLAEASDPFREHALADKIVYGINAKHIFPNGKKKTLDLAIGTPKAVWKATGWPAQSVPARSTEFSSPARLKRV